MVKVLVEELVILMAIQSNCVNKAHELGDYGTEIMTKHLITVVFSYLFLGRKIPTTKEIIRNSLPNLTFGYTLALGKYLVGLLAAVWILEPFFDIDPLSGAVIAIGFKDGHGTVAGLQSSFQEFGYSEGVDSGLGMATRNPYKENIHDFTGRLHWIFDRFGMVDSMGFR